MNKLSVNVGNKLIEIDYGTTLESYLKITNHYLNMKLL